MGVHEVKEAQRRTFHNHNLALDDSNSEGTVLQHSSSMVVWDVEKRVTGVALMSWGRGEASKPATVVEGRRLVVVEGEHGPLYASLNEAHHCS